MSSLELHPGPRHARGLTRHRVEQGARGEAGVPQLASCCTPTPDAQDPTLSTQSHTTSCGDCRLARSGGDGQTRGDAGPAGGPAPDPPHIRRACWVSKAERAACRATEGARLEQATVGWPSPRAVHRLAAMCSTTSLCCPYLRMPLTSLYVQPIPLLQQLHFHECICVKQLELTRATPGAPRMCSGTCPRSGAPRSLRRPTVEQLSGNCGTTPGFSSRAPCFPLCDA